MRRCWALADWCHSKCCLMWYQIKSNLFAINKVHNITVHKNYISLGWTNRLQLRTYVCPYDMIRYMCGSLPFWADLYCVHEDELIVFRWRRRWTRFCTVSGSCSCPMTGACSRTSCAFSPRFRAASSWTPSTSEWFPPSSDDYTARYSRLRCTSIAVESWRTGYSVSCLGNSHV